MLPSVRIEDIEAAIEVTECRHFSRAGEKLHRGQATISKSMKRVERGMGVLLIDRKSHPVGLTQAGKVFRYHAQRALDSLARGINEALRANQSGHSVIEMGYTSYLDLDVLAYLEHVAKSSDAGFSHQKHSSSSSEIVASVLAGKWDCGFIVSPATTESLAGIPVYQDQFGLIIANDHALARKRKISITDLRETPLILPARERNTGFRAWFVERCGAAGIKPRIVEEVSNPLEAWFLASQRAGAALILKAACRNLPRSSTVFRLFAEDDLYAEIQLVLRDEQQSPMLAAFVAAVLRMRDRMRHGELRSSPTRVSVVPRPGVKPWKWPQSVRNCPSALSA